MRPSLALSLALMLASGATAKGRPDFECLDAAQHVYRIWVKGTPKRMEMTTRTGTRSVTLAGANYGRSRQAAGGPLAYNAWNLAERDFSKRLDLSVEFLVQYVGERPAGDVRVSIVWDHRERPGVQCASLDFVAAIRASDADPTGSYAELLTEAATSREKTGALSHFGVLGVEAAISRMVRSERFARTESRAEFTRAVTPALRNLAESSVTLVRNRLGPDVRPFFEKLLEDSGYEVASKTERYATWIREGARPAPDRNLDSVHAGMKGFRVSPVYDKASVRAFFSSQVEGALGQLTKTDLGYVMTGLDPESTSYLVHLWSKAHLPRYREAERAASEILALASQKIEGPVPGKIKTRVVSFFSSETGKNAEARSLFKGYVSYPLKKLTPRQLEDIGAWFKGEEKRLFEELLAGA